MWRNPNYPAPAPPAPPQEQGERLATFPRGDGVELRVTLSEYQGRPYIGLRVWERGQDGAWWPVRGKGCSVRLTEAAELAEALAAVATDRPTTQTPRDDAPRSVDRGRPVRPPWDAAKLTPSKPEGDAREFDEFAET